MTWKCKDKMDLAMRSVGASLQSCVSQRVVLEQATEASDGGRVGSEVQNPQIPASL